jgi:V/A-type H+-transporting ATPase subunit K
MKIILAFAVIIPIIAILATAALAIKKRLNGASPRKAIKANLVTVLALVICLAGCAVGAYAATNSEEATETTTVATQEDESSNSGIQITDKGIQYLAACLSTGIGAIGGGIAVAAGAPAAIGAATEDPKSFGKSIIFVALGESIALYGVVISILILYS